MKPKKVLFFELKRIHMKRFPLRLSNSLAKIDNDLRFAFLSDDSFEKSYFYDLDKKLGNTEFYVTPLIPSISLYKQKIAKICPNIIVIFSHRLPDIAILIAAKQLRIPVVYFQHGLYIPFMRRTPSFFLLNLFKTLKYVSYAISIGFNTGVGRISGLLAFLKIFVFGSTIHKVNLPADKITADSCLVYSHHWLKYHQEQYGYEKQSIRIVGTPDLDGTNLDSYKIFDNSVLPNQYCYVAQSLVEDGRLKRAEMVNFLQNLDRKIKSVDGQLLIKLHPRSDLSLYDSLECKSKLCKEFPAADIYIGHYSTILIRGIAYTDKFLLVNFKGHNKIPDYIHLLASETINSDDKSSIDKAIERLRIQPKDLQVLTEKRVKIKNYFDTSESISFDRAANEIYSVMEHK